MSLKRQLREVKRGRQQQPQGGSIIADSVLSDGSTVVSESVSVVEAKLERLLSAINPQSGGADTTTTSSSSRGFGVPSAGCSSSSSRTTASWRQGGVAKRATVVGSTRAKGLNVTVRRCAVLWRLVAGGCQSC
jgi:hypothetical protein